MILVVALSWPFQIVYAIWGTTTPLASYGLSSLAMVMVSVATFIAGRYIFRDGFKNAGWRGGKPKQYSVYHAAYDEIRDAIEKSIGFGPLVSIWEMAVTTVIGAILLWRGNWQPLVQEKRID